MNLILCRMVSPVKMKQVVRTFKKTHTAFSFSDTRVRLVMNESYIS